MKLFKATLSIMLILLMMASCTPDVTVSPSSLPSQTPEEYDVDLYSDGTGMDLLVGIDEFGRVLSPKTSDRAEKQVGMFYWPWHGGGHYSTIVNTSSIIEQYGIEYSLKNVHEYNPTNDAQYWGEPLYGYYHSGDPYIIRRHLELLTYCGVDFIVFDATNSFTYPQVIRKICQIIIQMQNEGFNPPRIAYYTHTVSMQTLRQAYREIYIKEELRDAWYLMDGKPLAIAYTDPADDKARNASFEWYDPKPYSQEILDFFTFRKPAWVGLDPVTDDGWPWVDWSFPPAVYGNVMSVSVASHHWAKFSWAVMDEDERPDAVWSGGRVSWGRGYSFALDKNLSEDATKGTFYQSVWNSAHAQDPDYVFIGGWNEFLCGMEYNEEYQTYEIYDSYNMEFSRDIEMIKGGYNDAFVMQTAINVRKFLSEKNSEDAVIKTPTKKTVDIFGDASAWDNVDAIYRIMDSTNEGRDYRGAVNGLKYVTAPAQNAVQTVKITADKDNIYMYIVCSNDITLVAENSLNIFIGTGTPSRKGWEGYEYVINRERTANTASVMSLDTDGNTSAVGNVKMNVSGNIMQLEIPKSLLKMQSDTFYFKVADSVENDTDIMDYYVTGKSMPMGRFSYQYLG